MPKSKIPRITSRLSRSKASSNPATLGLQVTRQIVSLLGGGLGGNSDTGSAGLQAAITANTLALNANTTALASNAAARSSPVDPGSFANAIPGLGGGDGEASNGGSSGGLGEILGLGGGFGGGLGSIFSSILGGFGSLLSIFSIGSSLFRLFSGGSGQQQGPAPFTAPHSLSLEVANTDNILAGFPRVDLSADGSTRALPPAAPTAPAQPLQVTVNVSAMDSRSFSDYAPQLADAVRQAMLNMDPINQLIRESL